MSSARYAGESAICEITAQLSAEIVRVECAKCGESAICEMTAQPSAEIVRVECAKCGSKLWSWKLRTGDFVVQL